MKKAFDYFFLKSKKRYLNFLGKIRTIPYDAMFLFYNHQKVISENCRIGFIDAIEESMKSATSQPKGKK